MLLERLLIVVWSSVGRENIKKAREVRLSFGIFRNFTIYN